MRATIIAAALVLVCVVPARAQLTDQTAVLNAVKRDFPAAWSCAHTARSCAWDYIRLVACRLNPTGLGPWGLNGRRGNPAPAQMSWDALNYCGVGPSSDPTGKCATALTIIDVISGAGGPNPAIVWQAFSTDTTPGAWIKPFDCTMPVPDPKPHPPPAPKPYPGDQFFVDSIGVVLAADYAEAGQTLNPGSATWFARAIWGHVNEGLTIDQAIARARKEWRVALGLKD